MSNRYLMGSTYFFSCYSDFHSHDIDYLELVDTSEFKYKRTIRGQGKDIIQLRNRPLEEFLAYDLSSSLALVVGKYLIPEFCEAIGFTIKELLRVKPLIDNLDDKHLYEKLIYNSYIKNASFTLTEEQRLEAYNSYRISRGLSPHLSDN